MEIPHIGGHLDPFRPSRTVDKVSARLRPKPEEDPYCIGFLCSFRANFRLKAEYKSVKKAAMVFFFSITIPFGIALGIALSKTYKENSPSSLIIVGLLNASSVGLLYLHGSGRFQIKSYATVLQGNDINVNEHNEPIASLERIREEEIPRDTNPLAIVVDNNPRVASPTRGGGGMSLVSTDRSNDVSSVQRVKKEEVESKILAWQNSRLQKLTIATLEKNFAVDPDSLSNIVDDNATSQPKNNESTKSHVDLKRALEDCYDLHNSSSFSATKKSKNVKQKMMSRLNRKTNF